ncbi:uncharacterized protein LOC111194275 [Astyanax mexicanus]|uniref:uncharacterized protein LOC111194275 n=1 Tax=Astyanax mexicanus TaxID=7994 RepID=UPI0020CB5F23|nr:uncharacterized protein LOC111194275 [Astyanax mexicanus]
MVENKLILNYFRRQNEAKVEIDPTAVLSFIPSMNKEFLSLLGLEEVVQFRLELLDKFEYNVPKRRKGKAKKKNNKSPTSAVEPYSPPKDPLVCAQCSTDFSCSWEQDINGSFLCQSCLKCKWRKEHWCTTNLGGSAISPTSGGLNSNHILSPSSQPETNNPEVQQEAAFPFIQWSASSNGQKRDQKDSRISVSPGSTSSSPLSFTRFYSDPSSSLPSPSPSDPLSSPINCSSPFYTLYLSNGSSSSYYPSSSECNSSSSSMSSSPPHCSQYSKKKVGAPYWMNTLVAKNSLKDSKDKEETMEHKNRGLTWKNTEKTPISESQPVASHSLSSLTMELGTSTSIPVPSAGKQKTKTEMVKPTLKKTTKEEHISQTVHPDLKANQSKLQKASSNVTTLGLKQRNQQKSQVCNTSSVMMESKTSIPLLKASKQKIKTEKLKPSLKNATKEKHPSQTVHANLKLDQGKRPKVSSYILSMELKQHNVQKTQVCNTGSITMASTTSSPLLNASKQKVKTEKLKPILKKTNKEEHTSQTVHENLKQNQRKLQKASSSLSHNSNFFTDKTSGSPSSHSAKFKEQTSITLSFGNVSSPVPSSSTQTVRKGPQTKQTKLAFPSVSPSHSAKSSQYLPKFSIHHTPSNQAPTSETFPDSGVEHQKALWSGPRCVSECKPDHLMRSSPTNASSTQQGKTHQQAVVPQKAKVSKSCCPEGMRPTGLESQKKVHQRMGSSSVPDKILQKPK